ncbi:hypothetical protein B0H17DRAFT_1340494 [Mycena rosella]|uniref:Uncharacterized protein n=1 Tax=Mycena rosella TaxID=1033263 RepID=A0AAD7BJD2_MYCRO|nr:hypothetical protein B0H17DRAFT_1340494 [Mycena rosella]
MQTSSQTPSPSSHASSILRAILARPTPSPKPPIPTSQPPAAGPCPDPGRDSRDPSPLQLPRYKMFGLASDSSASDASSPIGDSADSSSSVYKPVRRLKLPPPPSPHRPSTRQITQEVTRLDVFGPVHHNLTKYTERRAAADHSARTKHHRTAAWIRRLRLDTVEGGLLESDVVE